MRPGAVESLNDRCSWSSKHGDHVHEISVLDIIYYGMISILVDAESLRLLVNAATESAVAQANAFRYSRPVVDQILAAIEYRGPRSRAVLVDGPRQVGKTVALKQVLGRRRRPGAAETTWYCDFADPRLRSVRIRDVVEALVSPDGSKRALFLLDEVHYCPDWAADLRHFVDWDAARFVVADSAAAIVSSSVREEAVGRFFRLPMHPLTLCEWLDLRQAEGMAPARVALDKQEELLEYLLLGGFPEHIGKRGEVALAHERLRQDVVMQAIRNDVGPVHGLRDLSGLEALLTSRLARSGGQLNVEEARETMATSGTKRAGQTARHWLRALQDTGLLWPLPEFSRSSGKFERIQPKMYAVDPALVAACSVPVLGTDDGGLLARQLETAVAQALRIYAEKHGGRATFYKRVSGKTSIGEADFVYEEEKKCRLIEVTVGTGAKKPGRLMERAGEVRASWSGVVALRSEVAHSRFEGGSVPAIPVHDFLVRLGRKTMQDLGW